MKTVPITTRSLDAFAGVIGPERTEALAADAAQAARHTLGGRAVVNVNSTAAGGGVAEMLHVLLAYVRGVGVDARWLVIEGEPAFFEVTKRLHNHLYGSPGDGGELGEAAHRIYQAVQHANADELVASVQPEDIVVLHDPQTAGLAEASKRAGAHVVWRCHVGADDSSQWSEIGWEFLRPYLEPHVDRYVFTRERFAPAWVDRDLLSVVRPSIDPFSPKNQELPPAVVEGILSHVGVIAGDPSTTVFTRADGTPGRVERYCDIIRTGRAPDPETPLVVQVSRWDPMKDMVGVMNAFARYVDSGRDANLVLAGPSVKAVADDPEGGQVLQDCWTTWRNLPHAVRHRVQLVCLPMNDLDENAAIVNALQRHATVVTQKSLAEGFGLTVVEAMFKGRPVVASAVGGIVKQITSGETGLLVEDPADLEAFAADVRLVLDDPDTGKRLGEAARDAAIDEHLGDTHLHGWIDVIQTLLARS